jgi:cyclopropane fatty-acyl-phospholipid synthase-like methyltransferase
MPIVDSPHEFHDAAYTANWVDYNEKKYPQRAVFIDEFIRVLNLQQGALRVLEIGSGAGRLAEAVQLQCRIESYDLLDSSQAMHQLAKNRLDGSTATHSIEADFSSEDWTDQVASGYDAVVTMQAVHELRNPARVPLLYSQILSVARPGAAIIVCDHLPTADRHRGLYMSPSAHLTAMKAGGLVNTEVVRVSDAMVIVRGEAPASHPVTDDIFLWGRS